MDTVLIEKVKLCVSDLFNKKYDKRSTYHSFEHTREVAEAAEKIGKAVDLNELELESVVIAAWFHDTGYLIDKEDHESHSAQFAEEFLLTQNYPLPRIQQVKENILATRLEHTPQNLMEEVIHDADYTNLANTDALRQSELLRDEKENYGGSHTGEKEWLMAELRFLLNHRYFTEYSKLKLEPKKNENIKKIKEKLKYYNNHDTHDENASGHMNKSDTENSSTNTLKNLLNWKESQVKEYTNGDENNASKKQSDKEKKKQKSKELTPAVKEFDTIYRLIATNHMRMNAIADRKASIMLSLNAIIISLTMGIFASTSE